MPPSPLDLELVRHHGNDLVRGIGIEFAAVGLFQPQYVAGKFDHRALHPQADPEERNLLLPSVTNDLDFSLNAPVPETLPAPGRPETPFNMTPGPGVLDLFRIHPAEFHFRLVGDSRVDEGLDDGFIGVMELHVFTRDGDLHFPLGMVDLLHELCPLGQVRVVSGLQAAAA